MALLISYLCDIALRPLVKCLKDNFKELQSEVENIIQKHIHNIHDKQYNIDKEFQKALILFLQTINYTINSNLSLKHLSKSSSTSSVYLSPDNRPLIYSPINSP